MEADLKKMRETRGIEIPDNIVPNLLDLMRYILKGVFMLNKLGSGLPFFGSPSQVDSEGAVLRCRIVKRLSEGVGRDKARKFFLSKLRAGLRDITQEDMMTQIKILKSFAVIETPTHGSVALERELTQEAITYLKTKCNFVADEDIARLIHANGLLR